MFYLSTLLSIFFAVYAANGSLPVSGVNRLLNTEYMIYEHEDGDQLARTLEWSLPFHLLDRIDNIQPLTSFMRTSAQKIGLSLSPPWNSPGYRAPSNTSVSTVCNVSSVTPQCFETLYSTKGYIPRALG
jgi:tripeptidyl-peptidase-1